jgi:glycosyltransferase involved in cell wall biosynthesis
MKQETVSIALCTYNGEPFLGEQLASLARQTRLPDELLVCDDRSTDGTIEILQRFAETAPFPIQITVNETRLGPIANFAEAADQCGGDIVLFCDQDDVWHDDKVALEVAAMAKAEREFGASMPILVHGDLEVVDESLAPLNPSYMRLIHPKFALFDTSYLLADNVAVGCTVAVNRALLDIALPLPAQALMHDWWFALCATCCGRIVYIDRPLMRYRQHRANQIGAAPWSRRLGAALRAPSWRWRNSIASLRTTVEQAKALEARLTALSRDMGLNGATVSAYAGLLDSGPATRVRNVLRYGYGRSGRLGLLWFLLKAIFA